MRVGGHPRPPGLSIPRGLHTRRASVAPAPTLTDLPAIARLVFLYADADGPCSLCGRRRHRIAACAYEVRTGSRQRQYTGIELCPGCLEHVGTQPVVRAMRRMRRQMTARVGAGRSPQRRRDRDDATAGADDLIRLTETPQRTYA